jgi:hypothetical protein
MRECIACLCVVVNEWLLVGLDDEFRFGGKTVGALEPWSLGTEKLLVFFCHWMASLRGIKISIYSLSLS